MTTKAKQKTSGIIEGAAIDTPVIPIDDLKKMMAQHNIQRVNNCGAKIQPLLIEIDKVLKEFGCGQFHEIQLKGGQWIPASEIGHIRQVLKTNG